MPSPDTAAVPQPARPRPIAEVRRVPLLAAAQISGTAAKPRGARRLLNKLVKGSYRLLHQRLGLPARGEIVIDPAGQRLSFPADFANTAYIDYANRLGEGGYEPEVTALFEHLAPALEVVYDIGANWGYFVALLMSDAAFRGRIEAFEIAPRTRRDLMALVESCGFSSRVRCHPFGLSEASATVRLEEGMHSALTRVAATARGRSARVERLDALALPDPSAMKIDVEGHEAAVLRGASERLARARPFVVFESWYRPQQEAEMLEPLRLLEGLGYGFFRLSWQPEQSRLVLTPLSLAERSQVPAALNLGAAHPHGPPAVAQRLAQLMA